MNSARLFADISDYQKTFDAHAYKSAGHILIAIKAGEDTGEAGATLYENRVIRAHRAGLTVMHYWFTRPENRNPREQARAFSARLKYKTGDILCLDIETGENADPYWFSLHCQRELRNLTNHNPVVYSYLSYIQSTGIRSVGGRLWVASYDGHRMPSSLPWIRRQSRWAKQFTDNVHFPGIGNTDGSTLSLSAYRQLTRERKHNERKLRHRW